MGVEVESTVAQWGYWRRRSKVEPTHGRCWRRAGHVTIAQCEWSRFRSRGEAEAEGVAVVAGGQVLARLVPAVFAPKVRLDDVHALGVHCVVFVLLELFQLLQTVALVDQGRHLQKAGRFGVALQKRFQRVEGHLIYI